MPSGCCSNCRTKYSLFNPENGCSNCAFSFCKKCVGYKAVLPRLGDKPVAVCHACYQKLEEAKSKPSDTKSTKSKEITKANWWGEGLPPPSLRHVIGFSEVARPVTSKLSPIVEEKLEQLEQTDVKRNDAVETAPSLEERQAALKGCDVEVVRNPKLWFTPASSANQSSQEEQISTLMEKALDEAALENEHDRRLDQALETRLRALKEDGIKETDGLSRNTDFSTEMPGELPEIQKLLDDAEKAAADENLPDEEAMGREMKEVNEELKCFRNIKNKLNQSDSEDDCVDDETVRRIVAEAEASPDDPAVEKDSDGKGGHQPEEAPKKRGFFSRLFRK